VALAAAQPACNLPHRETVRRHGQNPPLHRPEMGFGRWHISDLLAKYDVRPKRVRERLIAFKPSLSDSMPIRGVSGEKARLVGRCSRVCAVPPAGSRAPISATTQPSMQRDAQRASNPHQSDRSLYGASTPSERRTDLERSPRTLRKRARRREWRWLHPPPFRCRLRTSIQGSVNSAVSGLRWSSLSAPAVALPLKRKMLRPSVMFVS